MSRLILIVSGLPGSGKTSVSSYIRRTRKIPIVRMGKVTENVLKKKKLPLSETGEKEVRRMLRETYGSDIYAQSVLPLLTSLTKREKLVILEGVKSEEELRVVLEIGVRVKILYLEASSLIRHKRLLTRRRRRLTEEEAKKRDRYEEDVLQEKNLREKAHFLIRNESSRAVLERQCEAILGQLGYASISD